MTKGQFLEDLTNYAKKYRLDAKKSIKRSKHMNKFRGKISQKAIDALLADYINFIGLEMGVDYCLYTHYFLDN